MGDILSPGGSFTESSGILPDFPWGGTPQSQGL